MGITLPKQDRSRQSTAKVCDAVLQLLVENGAAALTIADVSAAAGVSVGTIYGRFGSRMDLLRVVHRDQLERLSAQMLSRLDSAREQGLTIAKIVETYVDETWREADVIRALVALARDDEEMADEGPHLWATVKDAVLTAFREASTVPPDKYRDDWGAWVFDVMFSMTLRQIEYTRPREAMPRDAFIERMSVTVEQLWRHGVA